ncbi:MAG: hypothetical protein JNL83_03780 [Myxococcales bacterium]|nr:hypothetical protein [Myxococcales bacterium]
MFARLVSPTILALTLAAPLASAEPNPLDASRQPVQVDLEVDPLPYALSGYSVHAGAGRGRVRIDAGVYRIDLPRWLHGNDGWDVTFKGAGVKAQYFLLADQRGLFFDLGAGISVRDVMRADTGVRHDVIVKSVSASAGYRVRLPYGFHATPWAGLSYDLDATDVMHDGERFALSRVSPFAAVHVGYALSL